MTLASEEKSQDLNPEHLALESSPRTTIPVASLVTATLQNLDLATQEQRAGADAPR